MIKRNLRASTSARPTSRETLLLTAAFLSLAPACASAGGDSTGSPRDLASSDPRPESVGTSQQELRAAGSSGALLFAADGEAAVMVLSGNDFIGMKTIAAGLGGWTPVATGEFTNDSHGDILWRYAQNGALSRWAMQGTTMSTYSDDWALTVRLANTPPSSPFSSPFLSLTPTQPRPNFVIQGNPLTGDLNADNVVDLVWAGLDVYPRVAGQLPTPSVNHLRRWTTDPASILPAAVVDETSSTFQVKAVGEYSNDGSGMADLFSVSSDGFSTQFALNGGAAYGGPGVSPDWEVKGSADFTADGSDDILWRNRVTGQVSIWQMAWGWPAATPVVATVPLEWDIVGAADLDGDNVAEIIWRDFSGNLAVTLMNSNLTVRRLGPTIPLSPTWKFVGVLRDSLRFGYATATVQSNWDLNLTSSPPCAAMDFRVEGTSSIPFTRTVYPTKKVERAWFACEYSFDFLDLEGTYKISYPTGCVKGVVGGAAKTAIQGWFEDDCTAPPPPQPTPVMTQPMPPPTTTPQTMPMPPAMTCNYMVYEFCRICDGADTTEFGTDIFQTACDYDTAKALAQSTGINCEIFDDRCE